MNRTGNKVVSILLTVMLIIVCCIVWTPRAVAAGYSVDIGDYTITSQTVDVGDRNNITLDSTWTSDGFIPSGIKIRANGDYEFTMKSGAEIPSLLGIEIAPHLSNVTLTLNNVNIAASFIISSRSVVDLRLKGTNSFVSDGHNIYVGHYVKLTISGSGHLECKNPVNSGIVLAEHAYMTLKSGTVSASGGTSTFANYEHGGAGVNLDYNSTLHVEGGNLTATGGSGRADTNKPGGAGIGGNGIGDGGIVIISGGSVTAVGGKGGTNGGIDGYAIGSGGEGTYSGSLTVTGGTLAMGNASNPNEYGPYSIGPYTVDLGDYTITSQTVNLGYINNIRLYDLGFGGMGSTVIIINTNGDFEFTMKPGITTPAQQGILVNPDLNDVTITLNNVKSEGSLDISGPSSVDLYLKGTNSFTRDGHAFNGPLHLNYKAKLIINGPGSLECSDTNKPGIYLDASAVMTLKSGSVTATGGTPPYVDSINFGGAGVRLAPTSTLRVVGGELIATGGNGRVGTNEPGGAGIGGQRASDGGNVIIYGGYVTAVGGKGGSNDGDDGYAIGASGNGANGGSLNMTGGILQMGNETNQNGFGPAGNYKVTGGTVYSYGNDVIPPVLSNGSYVRTSSTAAAIGFSTSIAGEAFGVFQESGLEAPNKVFVANGDSLGTVSGSVSGLTVVLTAGAKDLYIVVKDAAGNISEPLKIAIPDYQEGVVQEITVKSTENGSITVSPQDPRSGQEVTITVTPETGYKLDKLTITDKNENLIPYTTISNGLYTFICGANGIVLEAKFSKTIESWNPFSDVNTWNWFHDDVKYIWEKELMIGTSDTLFEPQALVSRAMVVTVLWRLENEPVPTATNPFDDLTDDWYMSAVAWAAENGIVAGYGDGKFGPHDIITREQLAAMIFRYSTWKGHDTSARADLSKFIDAPQVSYWALDAMKWANAKGLVNGRSDTEIIPLGTATRAELAAILHRFLQK